MLVLIKSGQTLNQLHGSNKAGIFMKNTRTNVIITKSTFIFVNFKNFFQSIILIRIYEYINLFRS